jgi:hypothetical protein
MTADQISQFLDQLGQKIGPAGNHVFELMVRQQYINGFESLLIAGVVIVLTTLIVLRLRTYGKATSDNEVKEMVTTATWLLPVVATALVWIFISSALDSLLNPEWQAISHLISQVTGR